MMPRLRSALTAGFVFFSLNSVFGGENPAPTNQEVLSRIFTAPILKLLTDSLPPAAPLVIRESPGKGLEAWLIQNLTDSCLAQKYLVYSSPDSGVSYGYALEISGAGVQIQYHSAGRRWLFFKKGVRRTFEGDFHLRALRPDRQVLYSRRVAVAYQDVIPAGLLERVENPDLPFTQGTKSGSSVINRWLEPVLVTATTITLIYLFYSLRSTK